MDLPATRHSLNLDRSVFGPRGPLMGSSKRRDPRAGMWSPGVQFGTGCCQTSRKYTGLRLHGEAKPDVRASVEFRGE